MMAAPSNTNSLIALAATTPMRDVIRGRFTGRLSLQRLVEQARLPRPLADVALSVARRTRLSRLEKADVAQELIAHFRDGLDAGRTADELRVEFGDPDQAARLIRRARRRAHSPLRKLPRYTAYGLGALAVVYLLLALRFFTGSPNPARNYLLELNREAAAAAERAEQCAWPIYREALLMLEEQPEWETPTSRVPGGSHWDEQAAYLQRNAAALSRARAAAQRPHLGFVAGFGVSQADKPLWPDMPERSESVEDELLLGVLLPHLPNLRQLARLMSDDAHLAAMQGDGQRAVDNIIATLAIANHTREIGTIINELVAIAIASLALDTTLQLLESHPETFSDESLAMLAHRIAAVHGGGVISIRFDVERMWFYDVIQHVYTDNGRGNGRMTADGLETLMQIGGSPLEPGEQGQRWLAMAAFPAAGAVLADRRSMVAMYEKLMNQLEREASTPLWQRMTAAEAEIEALAADPILKARYAPVVMLTPALSKATVAAELATLRRDAVLTVLAMHVHHRRHGRWPDALEDLVPQLLPSMPIDRFTGDPLLYRVVDGSPLLYSTGTNRQDNGGTTVRDGLGKPHGVMRWMPAEQLDANPAIVPEGDWVLWPPLRD